MENEVKAAMSIQYEIGPPDQGYTPIQDVGELRFDDIEGTSYLSAKTRFGEPSIRVVLLTADAFDAYAKRAVKRDSIYLLSAVSQQEARELMLDSVSVRWKLLGRVPPEKVLEGGGLSSLRIKKQGEVKNFCRSHPAGPRRIGLAQSSGKSTLPTKE